MATRDLKNNIGITQSLAPALRTASANGTGVDLEDFDSAVAEFSAGAITDGTFTPAIYESDDDVTYTAAAAAALDGAFAAVSNGTGENAVQRVGYIGDKRYIRVTVTEAGASPSPSTGGYFGANIVKGHPHGKKVA